MVDFKLETEETPAETPEPEVEEATPVEE